MEKYYVYILQSLKTQRYYCGQTHNLEDRITRHNAGRSKSTAKEKPWKIIKIIEVESRSEAVILERKIKKRGIQRFLNDLVEG